ncbi:MAG: HipA N-terminal domain-containing protein [Kiritimatiellae bacterium]|nr:HipA N-terminal domain-containing protein [Kiritimatiellia bacterium]
MSEVAKVKRSLDVLWGDTLVGAYDLLEDGSELFTYDAAYLASKNAMPISYSLPLRLDPYGKRKLRTFFAGLLPEETQRQRIASFLGIPENDDFAILEAIGGECAGALAVVPHGVRPLNGEASPVPCAEEKLVEIVRSLPYRPMMVGEKGLRLRRHRR